MDFDFELKAASFRAWLVSNGATISDKVYLAPIDGMGTGMLAGDDIDKGHVLFTVPKNLLLTRHINAQIKSNIKNIQWDQLIWTIIMERRNDKSFFAPYFDMLPQNVNTARSWNKEDKDWLHGTDIYFDICDFDPLADFLKASKKLIAAGIENPSEREFFYAADFISSYSFTEPQSGEVMMIPMADMLNHSWNHNAHCEYLSRGGMAMVATRAIRKGEKVYNTFGETGNSQLLLKYGFIEPDNAKTHMTIYGNEVEEYLETEINFKEMKKARQFLLDEYKVSLDGSELDKLFKKLGVDACRFYVWRLSQFPSLPYAASLNERQKSASILVREQQSILTKHSIKTDQS